jgi:hypothetical protein
MRCRDQQHIGAVRGERATAHRAGNDAREVKDLDPGKRALGGGQGLNRRVADLIDAEEGQASDGAALRMVVPLAEGSACGDDETDLGSGRLELLRLPLVESALHRRALVTAAE